MMWNEVATPLPVVATSRSRISAIYSLVKVLLYCTCLEMYLTSALPILTHLLHTPLLHTCTTYLFINTYLLPRTYSTVLRVYMKHTYIYTYMLQYILHCCIFTCYILTFYIRTYLLPINLLRY